jgi:transposase
MEESAPENCSWSEPSHGHRVWVTAANVPEREGAKSVLKSVKQMNEPVSRLHTIWADGGFDGAAFMMWVMDTCGWILNVVLRPQQTKGFVLLKKRWIPTLLPQIIPPSLPQVA